MTEEWLEHVEGPDGQFADLLKRYPYDRAAQITAARERDMTLTQALLQEGGSKAQVERMTSTGFAAAILRASVWAGKFRHSLTGNYVGPEGIGMAADMVWIGELEGIAATNYAAWYDEAYAGPKGSAGTDNQTPTSESPAPTTPEPTPSETGGRGSSRSGRRAST